MKKIKGKSLRKYLESELKANSYENPSASDALLMAADELREKREYSLVERAVIAALNALNDEVNYCENFSIGPLRKETRDKDIISLIKMFYKKQGFDCYKNESNMFSDLNYPTAISSYIFKNNEGNELRVTTSRSKDFVEEELMVTAKYLKRGMRSAGIEPAS